MLFNSLAFAIFLPTVFIIYWHIPRKCVRAQNAFLLLVSYFFYSWWDWRFLALLFLSAYLDFWLGLGLQKTTRPLGRKALLACSFVGNLSVLFYFKYYNFFVESFVQMMHTFGLPASLSTLNIILPAGISFTTFQSLSYGLDVYKREMKAITDPIAYLACVNFFPQLIAGPIERAHDIVPQFVQARTFEWDHARDGLRQMLWGLFKKVVIADNLGRQVDAIFNQYDALHGLELALGTVYFAFQIYCDFSGYSDIAIGCARLFGFRLTRNFAYPYFSRDIAEFWRRWHITLSTWFRDYVYLPLGGNRTGRGRWMRNILVVFLLSGFWHGANWTFVVWGLLHGVYYVPLVMTQAHRRHLDTVAEGRFVPTVKEVLQMVTTFCLVLVAWIFFRAPSFTEAVRFLAHMLTQDWLVNPAYKNGLGYVGVLVLIEWVQRSKAHGLEIAQWPVGVRWAVYYLLIAGIFWYGYMAYSPFIYFQF
jgi:D-alanyl-lipoteichoic acid acyltransferase DltB (MBOAT superfamily)